VQCARVYLQRLAYQQGALADWVRSLRQRRYWNVVVRALANKFARIAWAIAANHSRFKTGPGVCNAWPCHYSSTYQHPFRFCDAKQPMT